MKKTKVQEAGEIYAAMYQFWSDSLDRLNEKKRSNADYRTILEAETICKNARRLLDISKLWKHETVTGSELCKDAQLLDLFSKYEEISGKKPIYGREAHISEDEIEAIATSIAGTVEDNNKMNRKDGDKLSIFNL